MQALQKSSNQEVTQRAGQSLAQAQQYKASMQANHARGSIAAQEIDSGARGGSIQIGRVSTTGEAAQAIPAQVPLKFLKGTPERGLFLSAHSYAEGSLRSENLEDAGAG